MPSTSPVGGRDSVVPLGVSVADLFLDEPTRLEVRPSGQDFPGRRRPYPSLASGPVIVREVGAAAADVPNRLPGDHVAAPAGGSGRGYSKPHHEGGPSRKG